MKRREFVILTGIGATSATVLSACGHPENKLIPALIPDEEMVPGVDYWKASACGLCPAGCGIIVRTREYKANKIEGNPEHPINRGALCARGQAGLQVLYNPDRIRGPLKRAGERGSNQFTEISWDEAIKTLAERLSEIKPAERSDSVVFAASDWRGVTGFAAEWFGQAYAKAGIKFVSLSKESNEAWTEPEYAGVYGSHAVPNFDIANATYLLSFGARFLETWHSPVQYSLAYGEFRRARGRARGKFVQVEPRMSLTAANADEWLPGAIGTESLIALAIVQVIRRENLIKNAAVPSFLKLPLDDYAPEKIADQAGIPLEKIIRVAREFAAADRPLAIGGGAAALDPGRRDNLLAISFLNALAGNLNKPGGVLLPKGEGFDVFKGMRGLKLPSWLPGIDENNVTKETKALLIHQANPVYSVPRTLDRIKAVPFIAAFSSFMDETAQLADLILPDHSFLESWNLAVNHSGESRAAVTLTQPVVKPEFNTRQTADVLFELGRTFAGDGARPIPFKSAEEVVKGAAGKLAKTPGSVTADSPEDFLGAFSEHGVWVGELPGVGLNTNHDKPVIDRALQSVPDDVKKDYPFALLSYEHAALGNGGAANLPWLQELPDPMTSVMWGSWVEINPQTAAALGIADSDLVEVKSAHGSIRAPAVLYPAIRPDVVAMPAGQGHTAYGRYATGRGVNVALLQPSILNSTTEAGTLRVNVTKISSAGKLARFGTSLPERPEIKR